MQVPKKRFVFLFQVGVRGNHFPGNDKDMRRRLRVGIMEGQTLIVFINNGRLNLPVDDLEKEIVLQHGSPVASFMVSERPLDL